MTDPIPQDDRDGAIRFRRNLVRVMSVQVITLIALWLVQQHFSN